MEDANDISYILKIMENNFHITEHSMTSEEGKSKLTDGQLEANLRDILVKKFGLCKISIEKLEQNKEFVFYCMELFDQKKKLIQSKNFESKQGTYYYIKNNSEYFIIKSDDFSNLYYHDKEHKMNKKISGFKEDQIKNNAYTKFYLYEDKPQQKEKNDVVEENEIISNKKQGDLSQELKDIFIDDIKFNLISEKTISFYGENNNISQDYLQGYSAKGKLLSIGNNPYILGFGKENNYHSSEGVFHYSVNNYYIKLSSIKGQYDGAYKSDKEINIDDFKSTIIFSNPKIIPKDTIILFEFKNGKGGAKKVIEQAINYRKTAKFILKNKIYFHIIIIAKKVLGKALKEIIDNNKSPIKEFDNFAIICLDDKPEICMEKFKITSENESKKDSNKSKNSKKSTDDMKATLQSFQETFKIEIQELIINSIKTLEERLTKKIENITQNN